jgi:CRISPR-associated endonuclease/helicase Cas3
LLHIRRYDSFLSAYGQIEMSKHYRYWGKVKIDPANDNNHCHLLIYHALDVTAVAARWWDASPVVQNLLTPSGEDKRIIRAWLLFFIALHDIGKFDIRFQAKCLAVWQQLNPQRLGRYPSLNQCQKFPHGPGGLFLFWKDRLEPEEEDSPQYSWVPWLEAVCGHHGFIMPLSEVIATERPVEDKYAFHLPFSLQSWAEADRLAREAFIAEMAALFLHPVGLTLDDNPPPPVASLAGFCSVSDWLGSWSSDDTFLCCSDILPVADYFDQRYEQDAVKVLARGGVLSQAQRYSGVAAPGSGVIYSECNGEEGAPRIHTRDWPLYHLPRQFATHSWYMLPQEKLCTSAK